MVYDTGTAVGIGTTAPAAPLHVVSTATQAAYVDVYSNALTGVSFSTRAARGTPTVPSAVQTNDVIGGFTGQGLLHDVTDDGRLFRRSGLADH